MEEMLKQELELGDLVAYVYPNSNGKTCTLVGKIVEFTKKGCRIVTQTKETYNVKNVIKLEQKRVFNRIVNNTIQQNITLFDYVIGRITKKI